MEYEGVAARAPDGTPLPVSHLLYAANKYIAGDCYSANKEFMACKTNDANPAACLKQGERVQACVAAVLKSVDGQCGEHLTKYAKCIHINRNKFEFCRVEQAKLEECRPPPAGSRPEGAKY
mmetsp:Transcript_12858/g.25448  ORF Transcript_12858/g.25448 Transcript_12858/m.25448 type:complete len:121 (-) Transcript_12858:159-521(-)